jgi:hypothetical protein
MASHGLTLMLSLSYLTAGSVWQCVPNMNPTTPFTATTNGSIYCMSQDGISCMWRSPAECEALTVNPIANPSTSIPTCAQTSSQLYNVSHWCYWASQALLPPPSQCKPPLAYSITPL